MPGRIGEIGELSVGAVGDIAVWKLDGPIFAGVLDDLIEGWLRTGPHSAWHTVVAGRLVVESGLLVAPDLDESSQRTPRLLVASNRPTESSGLPLGFSPRSSRARS